MYVRVQRDDVSKERIKAEYECLVFIDFLSSWNRILIIDFIDKSIPYRYVKHNHTIPVKI